MFRFYCSAVFKKGNPDVIFIILKIKDLKRWEGHTDEESWTKNTTLVCTQWWAVRLKYISQTLTAKRPFFNFKLCLSTSPIYFLFHSLIQNFHCLFVSTRKWLRLLCWQNFKPVIFQKEDYPCALVFLMLDLYQVCINVLYITQKKYIK